MYLINAIPYVIFTMSLFFISFPFVGRRGNYSFCLRKNYNILQYFFLALVFLCFIGLRGYIWSDFVSYKACFDLMPTIDSSTNIYTAFFTSGFSSWEKGYLLYIFILKSLFRNYFVCQFISTIIIFIVLFYVFKKNCKENVGLCFVFFFLFGGFVVLINLQRNIFSILLFLLSIESKREGKNLRYYLLNLLGLLFHSSAFLYLLLGAVINRRIDKKILLMLFVLGNIIYLFEIQWLKNFLMMISSILPSGISRYIDAYLYSEIFGRSGNWGISIGYLERLFSFLLVLYFSDKLDRKYNCRVYINCLFLFIFAYLYGSEIVIVIERITMLLSAGYCVVYPLMFTLWKKEKKYIFIVILFFYVLLKITLIGGANGATKYETCFANITYKEATIRHDEYAMEIRQNIFNN